MTSIAAKRCMTAGIILTLLSVPVALTVAAWLVAAGPSSQVRRAAAMLDMDVFCSKDPFAVFVRSISQPEEQYIFGMVDQALSLKDELADETPWGGGARSAILTLGQDHVVACVYQPAASGKILELDLLLKDFSFTDLNVDGQWDLRIQLLPTVRVDVFLRGEWCEVDQQEGSRFHRKLCDGGHVSFDMERGQWVAEVSRPSGMNGE